MDQTVVRKDDKTGGCNKSPGEVSHLGKEGEMEGEGDT